AREILNLEHSAPDPAETIFLYLSQRLCRYVQRAGPIRAPAVPLPAGAFAFKRSSLRADKSSGGAPYLSRGVSQKLRARAIPNWRGFFSFERSARADRRLLPPAALAGLSIAQMPPSPGGGHGSKAGSSVEREPGPRGTRAFFVSSAARLTVRAIWCAAPVSRRFARSAQILL